MPITKKKYIQTQTIINNNNDIAQIIFNIILYNNHYLTFRLNSDEYVADESYFKNFKKFAIYFLFYF